MPAGSARTSRPMHPPPANERQDHIGQASIVHFLRQAMPHIHRVGTGSAGQSRASLDYVAKQSGRAPNLIQTLARPAAGPTAVA